MSTLVTYKDLCCGCGPKVSHDPNLFPSAQARAAVPEQVSSDLKVRLEARWLLLSLPSVRTTEEPQKQAKY